MSSNTENDLAVLLRHPAAGRFVPGAVLPPAADDPFPLLTAALHDLWTHVRSFIRYAEGGIPELVPDGPNQTPRQMVEVIYPALVCFYSFYFIQHPR